MTHIVDVRPNQVILLGGTENPVNAALSGLSGVQRSTLTVPRGLVARVVIRSEAGLRGGFERAGPASNNPIRGRERTTSPARTSGWIFQPMFWSARADIRRTSRAR